MNVLDHPTSLTVHRSLTFCGSSWSLLVLKSSQMVENCRKRSLKVHSIGQERLTVITLNGQKRPGTLETGRRNGIERIVENIDGTASVHLSSPFLNESRLERPTFLTVSWPFHDRF